ncbi:MAG: putative DNA binding domain-containing protein [Bacteroidales bacterium]|nr:putative DNA binding domain-containing protein [Bacteroidales bacterium]
MDIKLLKENLLKGERVTLECKKAQSSVPGSVWETYSALANTNGGMILLGVHEELAEKDIAKRFTITGVDDAEKIRKDFWNIVNNTEKVNVNLLKDEDVETIDMDGKQVLAIHVPRADYNTRPVYINNNPMRGTFIRNHEGDFHCPTEMITMMMRDANRDGNDRLFLKHYTMDDIDTPTLERYRQHFHTRYPDHPFNNLNNKEFLRQMGGFTTDRESGMECLNMAGLLMFGKGLPIRDRFDNLRLDYIDKSHLIGDQRYSDRLTYDGMWENNLFNFVTMVLPKLTKDLPRPFKMIGMERDDDTPQHKAIREAMTNAIIHADLMLNGVLKVEKYDDKFVFTNPGLLKLPVEQIYAGEETKARNQRIQNMFRMIGFGENLGSGFPLILSAWNENHWLKPELIEQRDLLQVKLVLSIETKNGTISGTINDRINDRKELSERQLLILQLIEENDRINILQMTEKTKAADKTIRRELAALQELGILTREGARKNGRWVIVNKQ